MQSDISTFAWQYTVEKLRRLETEAAAFSTRLHNEYFKPFDDILDRKAEYALKVQEEKGEIPPRLMQEIEVLEKFRAYVEVLEMLADERLMTTWIEARREFEALARQVFCLQQSAATDAATIQVLLHLLIEKRCPQPSQR